MSQEEYEGDPEEGEIQTPFPGDSQMGMGEATGLLQQTNPHAVLVEVENELRGNEWNPDEEKWVNKYPAMMNNLGISKVMLQLKSVVNTNCILSNLTIKDVYMITHAISDNITIDITANYIEYELAKSDFDRVVDLCTWMCFFALKRSYMEGERHFLKTAYKSHETIVQRPQVEQGWRFSPFKNRSK